MKKLNGFEETYYPDRWEHNGRIICKLTDKCYLLFDGEHVEKAFRTLELAEQYIDKKMTFEQLLKKAESLGMNCAETAIGRMMDIIEEETGKFPEWTDKAPEWVISNTLSK